jgi:hypothetical protein
VLRQGRLWVHVYRDFNVDDIFVTRHSAAACSSHSLVLAHTSTFAPDIAECNRSSPTIQTLEPMVSPSSCTRRRCVQSSSLSAQNSVQTVSASASSQPVAFCRRDSPLRSSQQMGFTWSFGKARWRNPLQLMRSTRIMSDSWCRHHDHFCLGLGESVCPMCGNLFVVVVVTTYSA